MIKIVFLSFLTFTACLFQQVFSGKRNDGVLRLNPDEYSQLPSAIIQDLEARKCTIPQAFGQSGRHNVIQGEFKKSGQKDWAILCSKEEVSTVLVYWKSSEVAPSSFGTAADESFLQDAGAQHGVGYSRMLGIADSKYIVDHHRDYGGVKPPKITHHGINDIFVEKASSVFYFHNGKWLELQGAD